MTKTKQVLRCFLAGCKTLSVRMLEALLENKEFEVVGVLTKDHWEDMKIWHEMGELHLDQEAQANGIRIKHWDNISEHMEELSKMNLDFIFLASWPQLVSREIMELPKVGCFNIHASYLPHNRGCMPIQWAIINGEMAGVTLHKVSTGVDNGHVVYQEMVPILLTENAKDVWQKTMKRAAEIFQFCLSDFALGTFTLTPQSKAYGSYHSKGLPYGGQINPYWSPYKKQLFKSAMDFPPFKNLKAEVPAIMKDFSEPSVRIAIGFDCDAPRGSYIASHEGNMLAMNVFRMMKKITFKLDRLNIPRTMFVTGDFLESMHNLLVGKDVIDSITELFWEDKVHLIEIGDHTYYHSSIKVIPTRPDRPPIKTFHVLKEWEKNSILFEKFLGIPKHIPRGFRAPYGHFEGLKGMKHFLKTFKNDGINYISSDLRDLHHNAYGNLVHYYGIPRQPYRYENGLLEIPSHGWQDTAFTSGKTPIVEISKPPLTLGEKCTYYRHLIKDAKKIVDEYKRDYFISLTLHPHAIMLYDPTLKTIETMFESLTKIDGSFCTHMNVASHYALK